MAKLGTQDTRRGTNKTKTQHKCAGQYYTQANTNNVNKTWALLHTTGGKDELSIVFKRKS